MGALADSKWRAPAKLTGRASYQPERAPARRRPPSTRRQSSWNVLAEELVSFPPAGAGPAMPSTAPMSYDLSNRAVTHSVSLLPFPVRAADSEAFVRPRQVTPRARGLRRLLPGAATLAVLVSVWVGAGALSDLHRPALAVPAGAVKVPGGYRYVARPGDTLWSIASKLEPGGDPRPLVAELEQQLHGAELIPGDPLKLP